MANEVKYLKEQGLTQDQCNNAMRELCLFASEGLYAQTEVDLPWRKRSLALEEKLLAIDSRISCTKLITLAISC